MEYLTHWGFSERPFENNRNISFFYPGPQHIEALERLLYLVRDGNMHFGLLTGEIGAGKTMVLHQFLARLDTRKYQPIHIPNGNMEFTDLLREILYHLERRPHQNHRNPELYQRSRYELLSRFTDLLNDRISRLGRLLVLAIDEAQQLADETLIELKNLTNLGTPDQNSLTIVLCGQPELSGVVRGLPPVDQRVGLRFHLPCLSGAEVGQYLDFRLTAAGYDGPSLFAEEAKREVYQCTGGIPREINRLCKLALDRTYSLGHTMVTAAVVRSIAVDVFHQDAMI